MLSPDIRAFWGKAGASHEWHPAVCHMIDAGAVTGVLLTEVLPDATRRVLALPLGIPDDQVAARLGFLCALHDIGKVSPGFQKKRRDLFQPPGDGFTFSSSDESNHGAVTAEVMTALLHEQGLGLETAEDLGRTLGGHHGSFPSLMSKSIGKRAWGEARREVVAFLASVFGVAEDGIRLDEDAVTPAWLMALAGLVSVSDWIGSDERFFSYARGGDIDLASYWGEARAKADRAIQQIGWARLGVDEPPGAFGDLFFDTAPHGERRIWSPNVVQVLCRELVQQAEDPFLLLVEAPTGSGKTEAALWAAEIAANRRGDHGLYYALPTQATSNQMLGRLLAFLRGRFRRGKVPLHLLHGMANMNDTFRELREAGVRAEDRASTPTNMDQDEGSVVAQEWFCGRKRGLLSPFAVGTVDQALLAALTTRHFFVRLFGLAQKTVVIDEVHAYDTYMSTLLDRLLEWLSAMGSSVILLSATLPAHRRKELVLAYTGHDPGEPEPAYPRVVVGSPRGVESVHVPYEKDRQRIVKIGPWPDEAKEVAQRLGARLAKGGCAAWICNTVGRAQKAYRTLREDRCFADTELTLFHARYPVEDRLKRERAVLRKFGKAGDYRPAKAIVVATQVIEQSLDLDFDFMVTDLAPVDLILQRAGRLHRHPDRERPAGLKQPEVYWRAPETDEHGVPAFGPSGFIYDAYVLLRTWWLLQGQESVRLPSDTDHLIEFVYGETDAAEDFPALFRNALERLGKESERKKEKDAVLAQRFIVPRPDRSGNWFDGIDLSPPDDDKTAQRLTRLARPTVTIVCVHETPEGLSLKPDGGEPLDLASRPNRAASARLLERSVHISLPHWYRYFVHQDAPQTWRDVPLLRSCRLARFRDGELVAGGRILRLDEELGLYDAPQTP